MRPVQIRPRHGVRLSSGALVYCAADKRFSHFRESIATTTGTIIDASIHAMIEACPHCYRKVIPMADETCPACGKNTCDKTGTDPHKMLAGIRPGDRLPPICFRCGAATERAKQLNLISEPQGTTFTSGFATFLANFMGPFRFINRLERLDKTVTLSLRLPVCRECWKGLREVRPEYVDFDDHRIDLVVHEQFKNAMKNG